MNGHFAARDSALCGQIMERLPLFEKAMGEYAIE